MSVSRGEDYFILNRRGGENTQKNEEKREPGRYSHKPGNKLHEIERGQAGSGESFVILGEGGGAPRAGKGHSQLHILDRRGD